MTDIRTRAESARNHPGVTCPASRHVQEMAEWLWDDGRIVQMEDEPIHCAESMLAVVAALWEARAEIARLKRGEHTCIKCGLRQDAEGSGHHEF
jgi:hypothetical protein